MITNLPGVALAILVADCAPLVLYDPVRRAIGVAHSGRVGTIKGVVPKTIAAMTVTFGSAPGDLLIGIGPAIGAASYEIGARRRRRSWLRSAAGTFLLTQSRPGTPRSTWRERSAASSHGRRSRRQRLRPGHRHQDEHGRLLLRPRRPPLRPLRGDSPPALVR